MILSPLQKLPKNVGDSDKIIVAKGFKNCPKSNKSPNLFTLPRLAFSQEDVSKKILNRKSRLTFLHLQMLVNFA